MRERLVVVLALFVGVVMVGSAVGLVAAFPASAGVRSLSGVAGSGAPTLPPAFFSTGENASVVLGKSNFTVSPALTNASTLCDSNTATFDAAGDLWVADYCDNRVLEFLPPFSNAMGARLVLGQANFTGNAAGTSAGSMAQPSALAFDG